MRIKLKEIEQISSILRKMGTTPKAKTCKNGHLKDANNITKYNSCKICVTAQQSTHSMSINQRFAIIKHGAIRRNHEFSITLAQYTEFIKNKGCFYCGGSLPLKGGGLDRIDNNCGYKIDNITTCCYTCNMMKRKLSVKEFISHCNKITNNNVK